MTSDISKLEAYSYATKDVVVGVADLTVEQAISIITTKGFRRLPIVADTKLIGMVTVTDILKFFVVNREKRPIRELLEEPLARIMTKKVLTLPCNAPIGKTAEVMLQEKIGSLPLISNDELVGIITERDLLALIPQMPSDLMVRDVMTANVITASPQQTLFQSMEQMTTIGFRRLPIITDDDGLVGLVCATDFLRCLEDPRLKKGREEEVFETPLEEFMTTSLVCIEPDTPLSEAASTMAWRGFGALLVTDVEGAQCRYGRLIGIITERDILNTVAHPFHEISKS